MSTGTIGLTIDAPVRDLGKALNDFQRKQLPFATVLAIKFSLQDAQKALQKALPTRFLLRNSFLSKGIKVKFANKRNLKGRVFTVDEILALQIMGGIKGGKGQPVPLPRGVRGGNPSSHTPARQIFRKGKRVRALRAKRRVFEMPLRGGDKGLFQRVGKARYPIEFLWRLRWKSTRIESSFEFEEIAREVFSRNWDKNFGRGMGQALASSR